MAASRSLSLCQCFQAAVFWLLLTWSQCVRTQTVPCMEVKASYAAQGFDENEVPFYAVNGGELQVCPHDQTCCTPAMEDKLLSLSRKQHISRLEDAMKLLRTVFASKTRKFDQFFTELLDNAWTELHEMFLKTYGILYRVNEGIFFDLFSDLRAYYKGKDRNLVEVMDSFFSRLLQKMFELLNNKYEFDEEYLSCVTEHMTELKPFGDVPFKLSLQVKRAFIAARTFVQGLAIGRDVIFSIMEIPPTESCVHGFMKMTQCPTCHGLTSTKPCNNFCLNTMKGCLAQHSELNAVWNHYIDALKNLAKRLEGPFNIESVVDPIDVKISDAIMNLQENSVEVTSQIFAGCGKPRLLRKKREAGGGNKKRKSDVHDIDFSFRPRKRPAGGSTTLDRLVSAIKDEVSTAKDFWLQLPYSVCNNEDLAASPDSDENCWNGHDRARYVPEVQKDGVLNQINNPEVEVDVTKVDTLFTKQVVQLRLITNRLESAYNGVDVDWIDIEMEDVSGSGSGDSITSGSGSGAGSSDGTDDISIDNNPSVVPNPDPNRPIGSKPPGSGGGHRPEGPKDTGDSGSVVHAASWTALLCAVVLGMLGQRLVRC